jgi:hypothetical protein
VMAVDAEQRGFADETRHRIDVRRMIGSQRARLAAQGQDLEDADNSASAIISDTVELGELDAQTIRNNAAREAWGFRQQAADASARGELAMFAAKNEAKSYKDQMKGTLLTGATKMYGGWANAGSPNPFGGGGGRPQVFNSGMDFGG